MDSAQHRVTLSAQALALQFIEIARVEIILMTLISTADATCTL